MSEPNNQTKALINAFQKTAEEENARIGQSGVIKVSRAISALSFWYEKLRTAMEYRDEHLLRRSAIQRILTRRLMQTQNNREIGDLLLKELVWARYLLESTIQESTREVASEILSHYIPYISQAGNPAMRNWIVAIASSDLEKAIASTYWIRQESLANFAYFFLSHQLTVVGDINPTTLNVQLYIALWRAYIHADDELIAFQLIKQRYPDWDTHLKRLQVDLPNIKNEIDAELSSSVSEKLQRFVERNLPPFMVTRDLCEDHPTDAGAIIADPLKMEETVINICAKRYISTHDKVHRAILRSIVYIFLTKMVFAFLLEIPLDRYLQGKLSYVVLGINSIFPPAFMFLLSLSIQVPDQTNTQRILALLNKIFYGPPESLPKASVHLITYSRSPGLTAIFRLLYAVAFLISFGAIYYILDKLHFSPVSKLVFVFFLTVVSFFAYRIRRTAHQYLFEEKESVFAPLTNIFMVPILRVGRIFSHGIEQINLLLFFFDLLIEAPFKVIFDLAEEWSSFIRVKKEEIV
jgi:hypothetical protein